MVVALVGDGAMFWREVGVLARLGLIEVAGSIFRLIRLIRFLFFYRARSVVSLLT